MKKSKKFLTRILSVILAMTMMTGVFATPAGATDAEGNLTVTFVTDENATVDLYYDKDYTEADETDVTSAYVRGKDSTEIDNSGDGQVNFKVNVEEGYTYEITVDGTYKNCKGEEDTGVADIWRITKIETDLTVTITTTPTESTEAVEEAVVEQTNISLSVGSDETERNLTWYASTDGTGYLYVAKESELVDGEMPFAATVYGAAGTSTGKSGYYSYQTTMTNLEYSTTYAYQIVNGDTKSEIYTFTTGSEGNFSFAFVGDPQIGAGSTASDIEGWANTLSIVANNSAFEGIDFLLSAGDQVNTASSEDEYDGYLNHDELLSLTAATVIGNHDSGSTAYSDHFNITNESEYGTTTAGSDYYYVYNGVLFMVLNSNSMTTAEHKAFMEEAIAATADQDITWKIVTFHHSIYSVASHATEDSIISRREALVPVFEDLGIDVVLMGHDHVYCRTYIMDGLTEITDASEYDDDSYSSVTDPDGILYVTANSASGSKYYSIQNYEFTYAAVMNQEQVPNVSRIDITDNSFTITTYRTSDMSVVDTFTIYHTAETECETNGHTVVTDEAVAATCGTDGLTEGSHCSVCGEVIVAQETIPATGDHTWDDGIITEEAADYESTGIKTYTCTVCDETKTEEYTFVNGAVTDNVRTAILWAAENGISKGYTDGADAGTFGVGRTVTREEMVIFLYRLAGYMDEDTSAGTDINFADADEIKTDTGRVAISWAAAEGIAKGYSDGSNTFGPQDECTREQICIFLWRLAGKPDADTSVLSEVFSDADEITNSTAEKAIAWAYSEGIVKGFTTGENAGKFCPTDSCLREQFAIMMYRYAN